MSIATQIQRLQGIKTAIRTALVGKGVTSASTHDMADFANDIDSIQTGGNYQAKTVSASTSQQVISPDSGYDALSSVTINSATLQTKTPSLSGSSQDITADSGYYGLQKVTIPAVTGSVARSNVLNGESFSSEDYPTGTTGTMTNNGAISETLTPSTSSQSYTVPAGYHNGGGTVTVSAVSLTGDADTSNVLSGKTFYKNSLTQQTGTMTNRGAVSKTFTPSSSSQSYTIPAGYHNGSGTVTCNAISTQTKSSSGLNAGGSVTVTPDSGKYLTSVTVSASSLSSQTSATATADKIFSGYTAWVNGSKLTGTMSGGTVKYGTQSLTNGVVNTFTLGFQPKYIAIITNASSTKFSTCIYNSSISTSYCFRCSCNGSTQTAAYSVFSTSTGACISSITSTGFTYRAGGSTYGTTAYYFAIG